MSKPSTAGAAWNAISASGALSQPIHFHVKLGAVSSARGHRTRFAQRLRSGPVLPWRSMLRPELSEKALLAQGVDRLPETLVAEGDKLISLRELL